MVFLPQNIGIEYKSAIKPVNVVSYRHGNEHGKVFIVFNYVPCREVLGNGGITPCILELGSGERTLFTASAL
jgi:hypothetical protein